MSYVIGVNTGRAASHDPSACLVDQDGTVLAFIEEERLSRSRHAPGQVPVLAVERCLALAGVAREEVDVVAVGWDEPRLAARYGGRQWEFNSVAEFLLSLGFDGPRQPDLHFVPHHRAHAVSAFYASPFDEAAIVVVDGNGENESISVFSARRGRPMVCRRSWPRVHSLGYLYEAASDWLGLGHLNAGKTMGLASYGRARGPAADPGWITASGDDIDCRLGVDPLLDYDDLMSLWRKEIQEFTGRDRTTTEPFSLHRDALAVELAWSVQSQLEQVMDWLAAYARADTGLNPLCLAGGVALNCAANGRLPGPCYVPPVPHDAGVALGAAWTVAPPRDVRPLSPYLGCPVGDLPVDIGDWTATPVDAETMAGLLLDGRIGGISRGRFEAGPRALCHRSILASPVAESMRDAVNRVKRREPWRPFGPVSVAETGLWSDAGELERYMVGAATVTDTGRAQAPAMEHVDGTTRPQRLSRSDEPLVAAVLDELSAAGHPPVLLNTSFNGPGQPIVDTAARSLAAATELGLDFVVINETLLRAPSGRER